MMDCSKMSMKIDLAFLKGHSESAGRKELPAPGCASIDKLSWPVLACSVLAARSVSRPFPFRLPPPPLGARPPKVIRALV